MNNQEDIKKGLLENLGSSGNSIYNDEIRHHLSTVINSWFVDSKKYSEMVDLERYLQTYKGWILSAKETSIIGLDSFNQVSFSGGVTQALDQFHYQIAIQGRSLRLFRGEYPYNRDVSNFSYETGFVDDFPLNENDALIISCPFSGTGGIHPEMMRTLDSCYELKIPVLVDLAWFGTCGNLEIDISHPAITYAAFSLTKGLTCGNYRSGIRFSKVAHSADEPINDRLHLQTSWNHSLHLNARIGIELMENFSPDTQYKKYKDIQKEVCEILNLEASPCVHIATSPDSAWNEYTRDGYCNRINLKDALKLYLKHSHNF